MLPFAVVGSMDEVKVGNRMVRARQYPWGTVQVRNSIVAWVSTRLNDATGNSMDQVKLNIQVENESHCDFNHLREMLLRVNLEDLRSSTHTKHYEVSYLSKIGHYPEFKISICFSSFIVVIN